MTTTDTATADRPDRRPSVLELTLRVLTAPTVGPLIALVLAMAFFSLKSDRFLDAQNLSLVLQQVMVVGVLAIGQTLVMKITKIADRWPSRKAASESGSQASGGTVRSTWKIGSRPRMASVDWPSRTPTAMPARAASE